MKTWQKKVLVVAGVLAVASWIIAIYYWGKLPTVIPTHFGFSGLADGWSTKSFFSVFFIPILQTVLTGLFVFLYWKPQYSDMPTTLWLMTMESHKRDHAFDLIRTMIVGMAVWIGILFSYLTYAMSASALKPENGLNNWIFLGIIGFMFIWLIWWTVRVYRATKDAMKKEA